MFKKFIVFVYLLTASLILAACSQPEEATPTTVSVAEETVATPTPLPEQPTHTPLPEQPTHTPLPEQPTHTPLPESTTAAPESTTEASSEEGVTGEALVDLALFAEPSGTAVKIGKFIESGDSVTLLQRAQVGNWAVVEVDGFPGWISILPEHMSITSGQVNTLEISSEVFEADPEYAETTTGGSSGSSGSSGGVSGTALVNQTGTLQVDTSSGEWAIAVDVHVPAGNQYAFALGDKTVTANGPVRQQGSFDVYVVTVGGNDCGAALDLSQLAITSGGQTLAIQNFHTGQAQIFIPSPC